jgi:hypothetical protein
MKKNSIVWTIRRDVLEETVKSSNSIAEILRRIGISSATAKAYKPIQQRMRDDGIDFSHISLGRDNRKGKKFPPSPTQPISYYLVKGQLYSGATLRKRLIREGLLKEVCTKCGIGPEWEGEHLTLQLDHIDGDHFNCELSNLRILCPNCHTQTATHSGKNKRDVKHCADCGKIVSGKSKRCIQCTGKLGLNNPKRYKKFNVDKDTLERIVWERPTETIAKEYGVSGKAIGNRCKRLGISKPPRGYWTKIRVASGEFIPTMPSARAHGEGSSNSKLTEKDVIEAIRLRGMGEKYKDIIKRLNLTVGKGTIAKAVDGKSWSHLSRP